MSGPAREILRREPSDLSAALTRRPVTSFGYSARARPLPARQIPLTVFLRPLFRDLQSRFRRRFVHSRLIHLTEGVRLVFGGAHNKVIIVGTGNSFPDT